MNENKYLVSKEPVTAETKEFVTLEMGNEPATPEMIRNSVLALESVLKAAPSETQLALETQHNFAEGTYCRTVYMRAGSCVTGKIHKVEHTVIVSMGRATVASEEFGTQTIRAPAIFVSPPGVKRALLIHEDMIWTTVHKNPTNTRDLSVLESELIAQDYSEMKEQG